MDRGAREALIARYQAGYEIVRGALVGITEQELDRVPAREEWTPRQIVHHLADSETISSIRLRRLLMEDDPLIVAYDERTYADGLHYDRPIDTSLALLRAVREANATLLARLDEADWTRAGRHSESGPYAVTDWLAIYAGHAHDHAEQIRRARSANAPHTA